MIVEQSVISGLKKWSSPESYLQWKHPSIKVMLRHSQKQDTKGVASPTCWERNLRQLPRSRERDQERRLMTSQGREEQQKWWVSGVLRVGCFSLFHSLKHGNSSFQLWHYRALESSLSSIKPGKAEQTKINFALWHWEVRSRQTTTSKSGETKDVEGAGPGATHLEPRSSWESELAGTLWWGLVWGPRSFYWPQCQGRPHRPRFTSRSPTRFSPGRPGKIPEAKAEEGEISPCEGAQRVFSGAKGCLQVGVCQSSVPEDCPSLEGLPCNPSSFVWPDGENWSFQRSMWGGHGGSSTNERFHHDCRLLFSPRHTTTWHWCNNHDYGWKSCRAQAAL